MCSVRVAVFAPHVAPVVLLLLQTRWQVMNEERVLLWLRQTEHIRDHLWHRYSRRNGYSSHDGSRETF